jgi:hypothetical protein
MKLTISSSHPPGDGGKIDRSHPPSLQFGEWCEVGVGRRRQMPNPEPKAPATWAEFKESWEMIKDIEREGLKLTVVEADKTYDLIKEKLRQTVTLG